MKFKSFKLFIIINLLLTTTFTSSFKLPNPSPSVLIVNHLNYLRYDYLSNPTSHLTRPNNYPFYSSDLRQLNRTTEYGHHQYHRLINQTTNDNLDLILNGRLDNELANRFVVNDQQATTTTTIVQPNDELFNDETQNQFDQQQQFNQLLVDESSNTSGEQNGAEQLFEQQQQQFAHVQTTTTTTDQFVGQQQQQQQQLNNQVDQNNNNLNEQQLNQQPIIDINNDLNNLIITNSTEGQQRLLELNLLQQSEPSLSLILDADSPFLNNVQNSHLQSKEDDSNETPVNLIESTTSTLNEFPNIIGSDLDDLQNSSTFNIFEYIKPNDEQTSLPVLDDISLPDNIDELANNLGSFDNIDFLDQNTNQNDNSNDLSSIINQDLCINQNEPYNQHHFNNRANEATTSNHQIDSLYIHDFLSDEDFAMNFGFPSNFQPSHLADDDLNNNLELTNEVDRIESDSAISSMSRSDWFDSASDSSSHFDDQLKVQNDCSCLQNEHTRCVSSSSSNNNNEVLDNNYELTDSNYDLYVRENYAFDDLNLEDDTSRLNSIAFNENAQQQDIVVTVNENSPLQTVFHNHTYSSQEINGEICQLDDHQATASTSIKSKVTASSNVRPQNSRTISSNSFESIRNSGRLLSESSSFDLISITSESSSAGESYERSLSRDEKKARQLQIPISVCDIIDMPIEDFNEILNKYDLNEAQLTLIKDIRRRGKNKVAAQNCRKRKINQIEILQNEVGQLESQKNDLLSHYDKLFAIKELATDKYQKLYDFIYERSQDNAALLANFEMNFKMSNVKRNSSDEGACGGYNETQFDENNTNQSNEMPANRVMILENLKKEPLLAMN